MRAPEDPRISAVHGGEYVNLTAERHCELLLGIIFSSDGCRLVREVVFERSA
jgi:hypothetical protein